MRVECVDLFEMERRRERRDRFVRLVAMCLFAVVAVSFGQTEFNTGLTNAKDKAFDYVKIAANVILFFMFLAKVIPALTGGQKDQNWWELVGILAAVVVVNSAKAIWETLTGTSTGTSTGP